MLASHLIAVLLTKFARDSVSDKLQKMIQSGGGKTGHSSVEDAAATLDLVRWWVINERPKRVDRAKEPSSPASVSKTTVDMQR